jgi:hypothetical protein
VTIHLRADGVDVTTPMTNTGGSTWQARLGPFAEHPGRRFDVVVEAAGMDGSRTESHIGTICVSHCHATRGNR